MRIEYLSCCEHFVIQETKTEARVLLLFDTIVFTWRKERDRARDHSSDDREVRCLSLEGMIKFRSTEDWLAQVLLNLSSTDNRLPRPSIPNSLVILHDQSPIHGIAHTRMRRGVEFLKYTVYPDVRSLAVW